MKDSVLFFRIATAYHLTSLIQCLHCPLGGRGSRKVPAVSAFFLFWGDACPGKLAPSARPAAGQAES